MRRALLLAGVLLCCPALAFADEKFDQMDANKDGKVTWEEFAAVYPNMKKPAFEAVDANADTFVSHEEWDAFRGEHARMAAPQGQGMGGGMMGGGMMGGQKGQEGMPMIRPPAQQAAPGEAKPPLVAPK